MARPKKILRTDHLVCPLNPGKRRALDPLFTAWEQAVSIETRAAWREWHQTGSFRTTVVTARDPPVACKDILGTSYGQMCMAQVRSALRGWVSGLEERIRCVITHSSLSPEDKHPLHSLNRQQAWGGGSARTLTYGGASNPQPVSEESYRLFKAIVRHVARHTRKPDLRNLRITVDQRMATLTPALHTTHHALWLTLSTLVPGQRVDLPLALHDRARERLQRAHATPAKPIRSSKKDQPPQPAQLKRATFKRQKNATYASMIPGWHALASTLQLLPQSDGSLKIALFTDMAAPFSASTAAYTPQIAEIALDLGMSNLFASDRGDLLGREWTQPIEKIDRILTAMARSRQRAGLRTRSPRYDRHVQRLRGLVKTEINRILNRLVDRVKPEKLILEHVDFRGGGLSRRMNRLLSLIGQRVLKTKLLDLEQRFGIVTEFRDSAYTSQECHACGYVDSRNRVSQPQFQCRWCGRQCHADVNAARTIRFGRSESSGPSSAASRKQLLQDRIHAFLARDLGWRRRRTVPAQTQELRPPGGPGDPRRSNPYFKEWMAAEISTGCGVGGTAAMRQISTTVKSG